MLIRATFSKPAKDIEQKLDRSYMKAKLNLLRTGSYSLEMFTEKQSFTKNLSEKEALDFIENNAGVTFRNAVVLTDTEEVSYVSNRHGEVKKLTRKIPQDKTKPFAAKNAGGRTKNYILKEGVPVPFLVKLGVMSKDGKVLSQRYDKFRQINHFLEFIDDIIPEVEKTTGGFTQQRPLRIADFGSGKSYLTFATYYFLNDIKKIPVDITGLDLKEDVIKNCSNLAVELGCTNLHFSVGNIADASYQNAPDIIITLHACDTATDFALDYAIKNNAAAILSVPCCQHEINLQLEKNHACEDSPDASILRYGLLRERFAALATDALRGEMLEQNGYSVQIMEFIDMEHTPKNILIRAVKKNLGNTNAAEGFEKTKHASQKRMSGLLENLKVKQTLVELIK